MISISTRSRNHRQRQPERQGKSRYIRPPRTRSSRSRPVPKSYCRWLPTSISSSPARPAPTSWWSRSWTRARSKANRRRHVRTPSGRRVRLEFRAGSRARHLSGDLAANRAAASVKPVLLSRLAKKTSAVRLFLRRLHEHAHALCHFGYRRIAVNGWMCIFSIWNEYDSISQDSMPILNGTYRLKSVTRRKPPPPSSTTSVLPIPRLKRYDRLFSCSAELETMFAKGDREVNLC